jgi:hypothetical protein
MGTERAVTDAWLFFESKWQCVARHFSLKPNN